MPWPVHPNGLLGAQGDNDTYKIERSLRFNSGDSAYLNRTPAAGSNRKKFTISFWTKISKLGTSKAFIEAYFNGSNFLLFGIDNNNNIINYSIQGGVDYGYVYTPVYRDTSAWYHFMTVWDTDNATANQRIRTYVNGLEITSISTSYGDAPSGYVTDFLNPSFTHSIGRRIDTGVYYDGLMTEFYVIDGQALTPSSFGETDAITGRWKAKAYSGTYGTNGFYLKFADNSSTAALGTDSSGNGNTWTTNNFSVTAGAGNDSLVDSPTNYGSDSGAGGTLRGNYATLNPLAFRYAANAPTFSDGNLQITSNSGVASQYAFSSIGFPNSGKFYYEVTISVIGTSLSVVGVADIQLLQNSNFSNVIGYINNGQKSVNGTDTSYGATWTTGDIIGVAVNIDSQTITFYKNNTSQGSLSFNCAGLFPDSQLGISSASHIYNFGQRPFAYTAPTGFKALCTTNLTTPTIKKPSSYIDAVAYTGTGASNSISSLGFSPDLVWIKNRGGATSHAIYDTTRLATKQLSSDTTGDEATSSTGLTAFGSNGFTLGTSTLVNTSGTQYVAWAWDESPIAGMDIVSYTGNGANRTIAHTIGVAPKMLIVKARTTAGADQGWPVWHTSIANTTYLTLSTTSATATGTDYWNSTSPTSSVFSIGTNAAVNTSADTYIAYAFAEVEGFSKFGSYTGNGSTDGPFVWCGFRPRWVMIKSVMASTNWIMFDTARSTYNQINDHLGANTSSAENFTANESIDVTSNGFKVRNTNTDINYSTYTHIFAAFAEAPFKYARAR